MRRVACPGHAPGVSNLPRWIALGLVAAGLALACDKPLAPPAEGGADIVKGAVLAAGEAPSGVRLYKVIAIEDLPPPAGDELHMLAFEPKTTTFEEARALWRSGKAKLVKDNVTARKVLFVKRDYRVVDVEGITPEERQGYERDLAARRGP